MAKSKRSLGYFTHGKEDNSVQAGVIGLVLGAVVLTLVAAKLYLGY